MKNQNGKTKSKFIIDYLNDKEPALIEVLKKHKGEVNIRLVIANGNVRHEEITLKLT